MLVWTGDASVAAPPLSAPALDATILPLATRPEPEPLVYTPPHLADKIRTTRVALEGERKQVTVLFADLKGSLELLADRDPEEARQLLDPVLERMMAAVHRYEGTVNQVMGDGIMALFGAPIAHEDHALRGEVWDKALGYCRQAGEKALARSVHREAVGYFEQALSALPHLPEQRALALATASGDVVLHALANRYLGGAYYTQGDHRRAIDCFRQTVASLDRAQRHERFGQLFLPTVASRAFLTESHAELGMFAEGRTLGEEGLRIAEAIAHPASLMRASWGVGLLFLCQGDVYRALPLLERALGICQDANLPVFFPRIAAALGAAYTLSGRVADAVPLLTRAMDQATAVERVDVQAPCSLSLGEAHLLAGRVEEAQALAERALALTCAHPGRDSHAYALRLLGEIAVHHGPPQIESAEDYYRRSAASTPTVCLPLVAASTL